MPGFSDACNAARRRFELAREAYGNSVVRALLVSAPERQRQILEAAEARLEAARREMEQACGGEVVTVDLPSGTRVIQEPGVTDSAAAAIREQIEDEIPPDDLAGLEEIKLADDLPPERTIEGLDERGNPVRRRVRADGEYSERKITDWYPPQFERIKHEIGHHVWFHRLTEEKRAAWTRYWRDHRDKMPTGYAQFNEKEGFAEAYEFFRNGKALDDEVRGMMLELAGPNPE